MKESSITAVWFFLLRIIAHALKTLLVVIKWIHNDFCFVSAHRANTHTLKRMHLCSKPHNLRATSDSSSQQQNILLYSSRNMIRHCSKLIVSGIMRCKRGKKFLCIYDKFRSWKLRAGSFQAGKTRNYCSFIFHICCAFVNVVVVGVINLYIGKSISFYVAFGWKIKYIYSWMIQAHHQHEYKWFAFQSHCQHRNLWQFFYCRLFFFFVKWTYIVHFIVPMVIKRC